MIEPFNFRVSIFNGNVIYIWENTISSYTLIVLLNAFNACNVYFSNSLKSNPFALVILAFNHLFSKIKFVILTLYSNDTQTM